MRRIYESMLLLCKEQKGAVKIIVALSMFMLIGFTALVVDVGSLYFEKSSLQKSLDAAVLGGAQRLIVSEAEAKEVAIDLASQNGFTVKEDEIGIGDDFIRIDKTVKKDLFFARVLGFQSTDVGAAAKAEIQGSSLMEANGVFPVGMKENVYQKGASYAMNETSAKSDTGNFRFLDIDTDDPHSLLNGIKEGNKKTVEEGKSVKTEPGGQWVPVIKALDVRLKKDEAKPYCAIYEEADNSCNRVVIVPIVKFDNVTGKDEVLVIGFASFWIEGVFQVGPGKSDSEIRGRFIETVTGGTFNDEGNHYGIYRVKLVNEQN